MLRMMSKTAWSWISGKDTDKIVEKLPVDRKYSFKSGVNIMFGCNNFCSYASCRTCADGRTENRRIS